MIHFDRRAWLRSFSLAIGGLGVSRLLGAPQSTPTAAAATLWPADQGRGAERGRGADSGSGVAPGSVAAPGSGVRLVRLSLNENPYGPSPAVVAALQREFANLCRYTGTEYDALVGLVAAREGVPKEQIILGEILEPLGTYLSLQGGPGGEFIYSDPGYTALIDSAVAVGGRAIGVALNARLENDLPAITAKVSQRTRAVFLVNPHNPTGIAGDTEQLKNFARTVSRQALVIVDEAYLEFADHFTQRTLADLVRGGENVIVFRTFAKVYGLAGLEIGYGLMPKQIAKALSAQGLNNPHLFNRLAVAAAAASLQDARYVAGVTRQVAEEREKWLQLFRDLKVKFTPSSGNFVFFETGIPHAEFAAALLKDGVEIGRAFAPYDLWARVSIGLPEENAIAHAAVRKVLHRSPA
jgi:histidinol-phosphate aminotransferase